MESGLKEKELPVRINESIASYFSMLGMKVALTVGIFTMVPILGYLFFHEYMNEGFAEARAILNNPFLWAGLLAAFAAFMVVLSKLVILPIKRFEKHISDVEQGKSSGPLDIKRNDEIGFLADRFNSLNRLVNEKIETRDSHLSVLHEFTTATAGILDIETLMDNFFSTLSTALKFEVAAYVIGKKNYTKGRIYSARGQMSPKQVHELSSRILNRVERFAPDFPRDKFTDLEVSELEVSPKSEKSSDNQLVHFIDLPLVCDGKTCGIVSLVSYSWSGTDPELGARVFGSMVHHTNIVLDRLFKHIFAEDKRLNDILSSMTEGVYIVDRFGCAKSINSKGRELVSSYCKYSMECSRQGFEPGLGSCPVNASDACEFSRVINKVRGFGPESDGKVYTEEIRSESGVVLQISVSTLRTESGASEGYVITAKDITDDRLIQKRVFLSSKLAALGEMAAGIAHEINNPLQVMMANIELLEDDVAEDGHKRVDNIKEGIMRVKGIVRDLLVFAREQTTVVEDVEVNGVVEKVVEIVRHQYHVANIEVDVECDRRSLVLRCNKNMLQQVVLNLLQNARDAIEESKSGSRVVVKTEMLADGPVAITITDDGPGIPEKIIDRIFDPFFTTKEVGKGTGLGLSVSKRIMEGMGGNLNVTSVPGSGTTFTVSLPHNMAERNRDNRVCEDFTPDYASLSQKTVLVVDDELSVARAVKDIIGPKVASIESVTDGAEALEMILDKDYGVVLLDIKMPGVDGMALYGRIKKQKPYMAERIIFLTGDMDNETTSSFVKLTGCRSLSKPFELKELIRIICENEEEVSGLVRQKAAG